MAFICPLALPRACTPDQTAPQTRWLGKGGGFCPPPLSRGPTDPSPPAVNQITDRGAQALAAVLAQNTSLRIINLNCVLPPSSHVSPQLSTEDVQVTGIKCLQLVWDFQPKFWGDNQKIKCLLVIFLPLENGQKQNKFFFVQQCYMLVTSFSVPSSVQQKKYDIYIFFTRPQNELSGAPREMKRETEFCPKTMMVWIARFNSDNLFCLMNFDYFDCLWINMKSHFRQFGVVLGIFPLSRMQSLKVNQKCMLLYFQVCFTDPHTLFVVRLIRDLKRKIDWKKGIPLMWLMMW